MINLKLSDLLSKILGRSESMFLPDVMEHDQEIRTQVASSRIMIIGSAGSIGNAFVRQLLYYAPSVLHLVDISENNLVELVRDVRSSLVTVPENFKTFAVALGSLEFKRLLEHEGPYDYVINFSAMKHVRSEKDPYSLMRMYDTNVFHVHGLLEHLLGTNIKKHFSVSSDKAANPASLMGATKIFMERILVQYSDRIPFSTARFANVAFSDGSLLHGFQHRLARRQPLSAPYDVRRYFISHAEAAQLCLLSCFLGNNRQIYFPILDKDNDMLTFSEIATTILAAQGYEPDLCCTEDEARQKAAQMSTASRKWPCYFFASDTTGEKPFEEFFTEDDRVNVGLYRSIGVISQEYQHSPNVEKAMKAFENIKQSNLWRKTDMVNAMRIAVPELFHEEKHLDLDQKM